MSPTATSLLDEIEPTWAIHIGSLGGDFLDHLRAHVLDLVFQLDLFRHGYTVLGHGRCTKGFVQNGVATLGSQSRLNGVGQYIYASQHTLAGTITKDYVFSHDLISLRLNLNLLVDEMKNGSTYYSTTP
jgi:hypothetical protein